MFSDRDQNHDRRGNFRDDRWGRFGRGNRVGASGVGSNLKGMKPGVQQRKLRWDLRSLKPFSKNLCIPYQNVLYRSLKEVEEYRASMEVAVKGKDIPGPIQHFEEGNFPACVFDGIRKEGFSAPNDIQTQGWPIALSGENMVGIAET